MSINAAVGRGQPWSVLIDAYHSLVWLYEFLLVANHLGRLHSHARLRVRYTFDL